MTQGLDTTTDISREDLVEAAQLMIPTLRERSERCEQLRQLPPETVADLRAAGFPRIAQPIRFGGMGLMVDDAGEVALQLARGCASTSWVSALYSSHNFAVSSFTERAQEEYWADGPDVLASTASAVVRLTTAEEPDGLRITGKFRYSSGCDYAEWLIVFMAAGMCLLSKDQFTVEDDWYVSGLRGTGSKAVVIDNVLVPKHRIVPMAQLLSGTTPGAELYPSNPFHKLPPSIQLAPTLLGPIVGMAHGVIDLFDERAMTRSDIHTGLPARERPGTQLRFAEATAEVDAATLIFRQINDTLKELGSAPQPPTMLERARVRRDVGYATKLCVQATNRLLESGDSSGMHNTQLIQRWGRDIHMGAVQFMATWDEPAQAYSQLRWGVQPAAHTI